MDDPALRGLERALYYGDGVFRTVLVLGGQPLELGAHLDKLAADASRLDLAMPDPDEVTVSVHETASRLGEGALRMLLARRSMGRGYAPRTREVVLRVDGAPLPPYPSRCWEDGVVLGWSRVLLGIQPMLAGIKHLNRLEQVLASRDWPDGQQEALLCDAQGRVVGGTRSNVFFLIDDVVVTPDLSLSGVAGCMREKIFRLAAEIGVRCEVGLVSPDEVRHAKEGFVTNSLIGLWPVRRIGSLDLPSPGPVTRRLDAALAHPWRGS